MFAHTQLIPSSADRLLTAAAQPRRALLVGARARGSDAHHVAWAMAELEALAREIDLSVVCERVQTRAAQGPWFGAGGLHALAHSLREASDAAIEVLVLDGAVSPSELRRIEAALGIPVIDRTELILRLFARRARTREAQLTIEMAHLRHLLPRLRERLDRSGREGGGGRGGRGNTQVALGKEQLRARLSALARELDRERALHALQRSRRAGVRRVALVGYTNAGKSSWLSALTGKEARVLDKPFATLETAVRSLPNNAEPGQVVITDTVGFVRDLPHELVPSFHATLDEARDADLCLCVADASSPFVHAQLAVTTRTLDQLAQPEQPRLVLLNKIDRVPSDARRRLAAEYPDALLVSAHDARDVERVRTLARGRPPL